MFVQLPGRDLVRLMAKLTDEQAFADLCPCGRDDFTVKSRQNGDLTDRFPVVQLDLSSQRRDIAASPNDMKKEQLIYEHTRSNI